MKKISFENISKIGPTHINNQDRVLTYYNRLKKMGFLLICDGIGGYYGGEVASQIASQIIMTNFKKKSKKTSWHDWLTQSIIEIKNAYKLEIKNNPLLKDMSTTLCIAIVDIKNKNVLVMNLGDSMCMVCNSDGKCLQLVNHHTYLNYLIKTNQDVDLIRKQKGEACLHSLVNYISANSPSEIWFDEIEYELKDDDVLIVCSDGIYKFITIKNFIFKNKTSLEICKIFLKNAQENRTTDDASIGVMKYEVR